MPLGCGLLFLLFRLLHLVLDGGKEAAESRSGGNSAFERMAFPKGNNVLNRILQTEAIGGTLRAEQFYLGVAEVGTQAGNFRLLAAFIAEHP